MEISYTEEKTGRNKLEAVAEAWGFVQQENTAHRKFVSNDDWKQWVDFDKQTVAKLSEVVEGFNGRTLTEEQNEVLDSIIKSVGGAKRKSEHEFKQEEQKREDAAKEELERQRSLKELEKAKKERELELKGFKAKLKGFFSK